MAAPSCDFVTWGCAVPAYVLHGLNILAKDELHPWQEAARALQWLNILA